jgi:anti-sigma regulatory factor (Ser/Thr protein kinase)
MGICKKGSDRFDPVEKIYPQLSSLNKMTDMTTDGKDILIFLNVKSDLFFLNTKTFKLDSLAFPRIDSTKQFDDLFISLQYDSSTSCVYASNRKNIWQYNLEKKTSKLFAWDSTMRMRKGMVNIDASGQLWVQPQRNTLREIRIYDPETFGFKRKIGLTDPRIENSNRLQILQGPKPYMFIMHDEGMTLYNYDDNSFRLFDKDNGLLYDFVRFFNFTNHTYFSAHNNTVQYASFDKLVSLSNQRVSFINRLAVHTQRTTLLPDLSNNRVELDHKQNTIGISFSAIEHLFPEKVQYAFRLSELDHDWRYADYKSREIVYSNLSPGKYVFQLKAQMLGGNWQQDPLELYITITPPFWQTWWFRILAGLFLISLAFFFIRWRIALVRKKEQLKSLHEKELLEIEAKALRAQMNPHFVFNSLNSIKSLINKNENDKAANYLTTFSKLIRTLFHNSDKREVSLFEEIETCKLYTQLERMRFGDKIDFIFNVDGSIDLKDIKVPALILQPLIENAIWHGLVPKETGGKIVFSVKENNGAVECTIDDDGIGRELSNQYKAEYRATHQSKGIGMTQSRLELDKLLNDREDTIRIIDKINKAGKPDGTKVIITFKETGN